MRALSICTLSPLQFPPAMHGPSDFLLLSVVTHARCFVDACVMTPVLCRYGIAFLYGAKLVREEGYSAGQVMNVIFAAIIGGFSLGQAGPNFGTFATGRTAGFRVFRVVDRKPAIDLADKGLVPSNPMQVCVCQPSSRAARACYSMPVSVRFAPLFWGCRPENML